VLEIGEWAVLSEQEARIAILEYFASEMQGYKVSLLTLAVAFLGLVELWSRVYCFLPLKPLWAFVLWTLAFGLSFGPLFGATSYCIFRIAFFGKFVELSYRASACSDEGLMLNRVDMGIRCELRSYLSEKSGNFGEKLWKRLIRCGQTAYAGLRPSAFVSAIVFIFAVILAMYWLLGGFCVVGA
jgi:hypothetical protein